MVAPYATTALQNNNKCPHGLPVGTCPICNGSGGGAMRKDRDKPRVPGEMTYAECMAAWIKIQAAQDAKIQAQINKLEQAQALSLQNRLIEAIGKAQNVLDNVMKNIEQMPKALAIPAKIIINVIVKPILNLISKIPQLINSIQTAISNIAKFINSVGEKLASVFGEIKNFIDAKISQPLKKLAKKLTSIFTQEETEENEEVQKLKTRELKEVLKSLFRLKKRKEEEQDKEEEL